MPGCTAATSVRWPGSVAQVVERRAVDQPPVAARRTQTSAPHDRLRHALGVGDQRARRPRGTGRLAARKAGEGRPRGTRGQPASPPRTDRAESASGRYRRSAYPPAARRRSRRPAIGSRKGSGARPRTCCPSGPACRRCTRPAPARPPASTAHCRWRRSGSCRLPAQRRPGGRAALRSSRRCC